MGFLRYIYDYDYDPTDAANPAGTYAPYDFVPVGHAGPVNMTMNRDFARRESVVAIPGADGVLDANGRNPGPTERFDQSFAFRVFTDGDNDAAHDLLAAQVAPGAAKRLVYQTDSGALWYAKASNGKIGAPLASANSWGHGGFVDFSVTWRRTVWTPRYPDSVTDIWGVNDGIWGTADGNWSSGIALSPAGGAGHEGDPVNFTLDATGIAGSTLPTLDDYAPLITVTGPFGGAGGWTLVNASLTHRNAAGVAVPLQITVPVQLPTANDVCVLDCGARSFTSDGVPIRPVRGGDLAGDHSQTRWWGVKAGLLNGCYAQALGAGPLVGGNLVVQWFRKRA